MSSIPKLVHGRPGQFKQTLPTWGQGVQSADGKMILISTSNRTVRLGTDGEVDTGFGTNGFAANHIIFGSDLSFDSQGKLWMLGWATSPTPGEGSAIIVERVDANGKVDTTFNGGNPLVIDKSMSDTSLEFLVQPGGRMVIAGQTNDEAGMPTPLFIRVNTDGSVDTGFGQSYRAATANLSMHDAAVQSNGAIVLAGYEMYSSANTNPAQFCVQRVTADGAIDTSFGTAGRFSFALPDYVSCSAYAIDVQADGKILVAGLGRPAAYNNVKFASGVLGNLDELVLIRLNADGTLDRTFGEQGIAKAPVNPWAEDYHWDIGGLTWAYGAKMLVRPDGRIIVGTTAAYKMTENHNSLDDEKRAFAVQFSADGKRDLAFGTNGAATTEVNGLPYTELRQIELTPGGGIVMVTTQNGGGNFTINQSAQYYLDGNGRPDNSNASILPTASTLETFRGAPNAVLDADLGIVDGDVGAGGSHAGATLSLQRAGGANAQDMFVPTSLLRLVAGRAFVDGVDIGTASNANGILHISFNTNATTERVNLALGAIAYTNLTAGDQGESVALQWLWQDAAGNQARFASTVNIAAMDVPYWIDAMTPGQTYNRSAASMREEVLSLIGPARTYKVNFDTLAELGRVAKEPRLLNATEKAAVLSVLTEITRLTGLRFEPGEEGDHTISFATSDINQTFFSTYPYSGDPSGSNMLIGFRDDGSGLAGPNLEITLHEIGHALGLRHPFPERHNGGLSRALPLDEQTDKWSVMSYVNVRPVQDYHAPFYADLDIALLQYLYGVNPATRSGNDTYQLDPRKPNFIWDGSGSDTISASGLGTPVTLHLDPGHWDYIGALATGITHAGQVTINFGTAIENAIGGSGNDRLSGNALDNKLTGGLGNDMIDGGAGTDIAVFAGKFAAYQLTRDAKGNITMLGADGLDQLTSIEILQFDDAMVSYDVHGQLVVYAMPSLAAAPPPATLSIPSHALRGSAGADDIRGNAADNVLYGAGGNDVLDGGAGRDLAILGGNLADYAFLSTSDGKFVLDTRGHDGDDLLRNIERLQFADTMLALDVDGNAGAVARLYLAAFGRTPDPVGMGFWLGLMDSGTSQRSIAEAFVHSKEFSSIYGESGEAHTFLWNLYKNALHRSPDTAGMHAWWSTAPLFGPPDMAWKVEVLLAFCNSPESMANLIGTFPHGVPYMPS